MGNVFDRGKSPVEWGDEKRDKNKAVYTAASVACGWAGAV